MFDYSFNCVFYNRGAVVLSLGNDRLLSNTCSPASSSSCGSSLPKMAGNGEGVHTHAHGFRGDGTELLPV